MTIETGDHRCRLCTTNDLDGMIEQLAQKMWESYRPRKPGEAAWADADEYWQHVFRGHARCTIDLLRYQ